MHANLYGKYSGFLHVLAGGDHTGGEGETPNISFAYGFGGGLEYKLSRRFSIRASGDAISSSFSLRDNTPQLALSPHRSTSSRATVGAVYHF